jgi:hypothetical protein
MKKVKAPRLYAPRSENWNNWKYPFDDAACGDCITQHALSLSDSYCSAPGHEVLHAAARKAFPNVPIQPSTAWLKKHYKKIVALRRKFASCWAEGD